MSPRKLLLISLTVACAIPVAAQAMPADFGDWGPPVRVEDSATGAHPDFNGSSLDGCPMISRDEKTFYMASNRPGGLGGIDIWVSTRSSENDPWGQPVNVGAPVNSDANDFCPTIDRNGHRFYFVSNRAGGCGGDDVYTARLKNKTGFQDVENIGCDANSSANEAGPAPIPERGEGPSLYFSSNRTGNSDIYVSRSHGGRWGTAQPVAGVNSPSEDGQPSIRRDGLELFFYSNRPGSINGSNDIYVSTRPRVSDPWSTPVNLGPDINSPSSETRPNITWDGTTLYFGSGRPGGEGQADHYVTTR